MTCSIATTEPVITAPWQATTPLMAHQTEAVAKLLPPRIGALLMEMGTGKTRTAIELLRIRQRKISRAVWFCPVSLMETIYQEILKHTDCPPEMIYSFGARTSEATLPMDRWWYIVGIESMASSARVVCSARLLIDARATVVVDESTYIKGHRAKRTARITALAAPARYRLILTGTPITQGVVDLYAQMRFLDWRILGYRSWYTFRTHHLHYEIDRRTGRRKNRPPTEINKGWIAAKIRPYVYQVTKAECLDLPEKIHRTHSVSLTWQQQGAYEEAKTRYLEEAWLDDEWDSLRIFQLFTALQGIVCGFWRDGDRFEEYPHNRLDALLAVLHQIPEGERVVIWAKYRYCVAQIVGALRTRWGIDAVAEYHGGITPAQRTAEVDRWRDSAGRYLVATQAAGGHGHNWADCCAYAVTYASGFKYSEYLQAEDRIHRIGQERKTVYTDIYAPKGIDARIAKAIATKGSAVQAFKAEVDKIKANRKARVAELVRSL